jgi:hypothetical protein
LERVELGDLPRPRTRILLNIADAIARLTEGYDDKRE